MRSASGPRSITCPATAFGRKTPSRRADISPSASARARANCCATAIGCAISAFTNRSDPQAGSGLELIRWHRQKAGTIEHAHDVLMNELAGAALPSQKFGANAAWLRLNVALYNLLSAFKRVGLPEEFHTARPKRLRFLLLNTVGKVVRHARETLLRCTKEIARVLAGAPRTRFALKRPALAGV